MKKYLLSFFLVVAFAFYAVLNNQNSVDIGPSANGSVAANINTGNSISTNAPAEPTPKSAGSGSGGGSSVTTQTPTPTSAQMPPASMGMGSGTGMGSGMMGIYKDGSYAGQVTDAYFGNVQVKAIVQGGKLTDVQVLQYPNDRGTSREINGAAMPQLVQEAIQAQSANVNIVSGATQSSEAFQQSLASALAQAKV